MASESKDGKRKSLFSKHDISMLGIRSNLVQASFSYERMHAPGWTWAQLPYWEKIYRNDPKGLKRVMADNMEFINSSPPLYPILMGLLLTMEEDHVEPTTIKGLKNALFGPMAGIGDAIFWFTIMPIVGGISASIAKNGNVFGPLLFFLVYLFLFWSRMPLAHLGYNLGTRAIDVIQENSKVISHVASILGLTVIGGLIASYVKMELKLKIGAGNTTISLQKQLLDKIFPNILPFAFVFLLYWLLKKNVNPIWLIVLTFAFAIVMSLIGWM
ncbi:PTS galactosamine transporter subunit IID [Liquorilactobacillus satsumensis]|uniref:PTS family N-acetylgalactosamine (Nac) porter component IID n=1 Tax=Liquorilactobacillus satsumensis DSM 16230 = JCM 12392 TaxID=1423801 RepID=A0A0R1V0M7_9LACO|nr:PTS galactosamine transporter subunit IID [Liquorilactobacillus satsumensis]KRL99022.1 PTS family N-acetylgalactosamine (nac) porter component IID [Liquorilactobacillus satsumensis DSM 16230 = JCM 12392]MCC7666903.1 PTS N-acetylgalactosamine transporter subunit IID [Liquorilactobacillus satsumensis]MCP9357185.1 PTS N-acetylgalactosamine transporter subunit IID [Liquorilactobacillus satsumensis]MCP9371132.1 PTS N-acetylgalactosamine transporter subunit IID [Liquorilactobacillus satsumensis]